MNRIFKTAVLSAAVAATMLVALPAPTPMNGAITATTATAMPLPPACSASPPAP